MEPLPETQTLYAQFLDQLVALHARRTIGLAPGCFTKRLDPAGCRSIVLMGESAQGFLGAKCSLQFLG